MSELNSNSSSLEMEASERRPLPRDTTLATFRSLTSPPREPKSPLLSLTQISEKSPSTFGTLPDRRNSESSESATISRQIVPLSCLTSPQGTPIGMLINGTRTLPRSVPMFQFAWSATRPMSRIERSRQIRLDFTGRGISSIMTFRPNPTISSRSPSFTYWDSYWVILMWLLQRTWEWIPKRSKWTRSTSDSSSKRSRLLSRPLYSNSQMRRNFDKNC